MYKLTAAERKMLLHLFAKLDYDDDISISSLIAFINDHLLRISIEPISLESQIMIDRIALVLKDYRRNLSLKSRDEGRVSMDVNAFKKKLKELPALLNKLEAMTRLSPSITEADLKFLYFTNRAYFINGSEIEKLGKFNEWLIRISQKSGIDDVLLIATNWVEDLSLLQTGKSKKKKIVTSDAINLEDLRVDLFVALRMNFGDLYRIHARDLRKLLFSFNANLLSPRAKKPGRLLKNESLLDILEGKLTKSLNNLVKPSSIIVIDNRNNPEAVVFISKTFTDEVPDYALKIPKNKLVKVKATVISVYKANIIIAGFRDPTKSGSIKPRLRIKILKCHYKYRNVN